MDSAAQPAPSPAFDALSHLLYYARQWKEMGARDHIEAYQEICARYGPDSSIAVYMNANLSGKR